MNLLNFHIPDGKPLTEAFKRTTHVGVGAHQDDLELLALHGILKGLFTPCFGGIVLTDGRSSPRDGRFKNLTDEQMAQVRKKEQIRASEFGRYSFVGQLGHGSDKIKSIDARQIVEDEIFEIFEEIAPSVVYTHAPTDKHETHVASLMCVLESLRRLPPHRRPKSVLGCEVWRDLDWVPDEKLVVLDVSDHDAFLVNLMGCFESQLAGGKRYDLAALGRQRANATFRSAKETDTVRSATLALELIAFVDEPKKLLPFIKELQQEFHKETERNLQRHLR